MACMESNILLYFWEADILGMLNIVRKICGITILL